MFPDLLDFYLVILPHSQISGINLASWSSVIVTDGNGDQTFENKIPVVITQMILEVDFQERKKFHYFHVSCLFIVSRVHKSLGNIAHKSCNSQVCGFERKRDRVVLNQ